MDELQFNESLDALLANEAAMDASSNNHNNPYHHEQQQHQQQNNHNNMMMNDCSSSSSGVAQSYTFPTAEGLQQEQHQQQHHQQGMYPSYATTTTFNHNNLGYDHQHQHQRHHHQQQQLDHFPTNSAAVATAAGTIDAHNHHHVTQQHHSGAASVSSRGSFNSFGSSNYPPSSTGNQKVAAATTTGGGGGRARRRGSNASSTTSSTTKQRLSGSKRSRGSGGGGDRSTMTVSEDEDDKDKRRQDRNMREQQRSHQITSQIDHLREVLASANVPFKPDKYSTLVSVVDYIKELQERSSMLDAEHKKLIDTIARTDNIVKESHLPPSASANAAAAGGSSSSGVDSSSLSASGSSSDIYNEDELVFVRNVDYKSIFFRCGMPLAVASIDGRFLDCNVEFETATGYKREELLPSVEPLVIVTGAASEDPSSLSAGSGMDELGNPSTQPLQQGGTDASTDTASPDDIASSTSGSAMKSNTGQSKNLSLFNLLCRDCMEHVFLALSKILKHPDDKDEESAKEPPTDHWTGIVRLNRNPENEVRSLYFNSIEPCMLV